MAEYSIGASDVSALIPEETAAEIIQNVTQRSAAFDLMRNVRMSTNQQRMPVLSMLPSAGFVSSGGGLKPLTKAAWENKYLNVEEIAAIVPIPEAYLDDTAFDVWGQLRPLIEEAIAICLDGAVLFGINKPTSWGKSVLEHADDAGNEIIRGAVAARDIAGDVSAVMTMLETDGFDVNGFAARRAIRGSFRDLRDEQGNPIFVTNLQEKDKAMLWGETLKYVGNGGWDAAEADLLAGDWNQGVIATRQDVTFKILTEASLYDTEGQLVYALAQQDMVALRVVARFAYEVANAVNREGNISDQSPFGILRPVGYS